MVFFAGKEKRDILESVLFWCNTGWTRAIFLPKKFNELKAKFKDFEVMKQVGLS